MKSIIIKIWNAIKNAFKLLLIALVRLVVSFFPDRNKPTTEVKIDIEVKSNKEEVIIPNDESSLPDEDNIKTNPDNKGKIFKLFNISKNKDKKVKELLPIKYTNDTLDKLIDKIFEEELKLKIKDVSKETKEYLKEYKNELIYVVKKKIEYETFYSEEQLSTTIKPIVLDELKKEPLVLKEKEAKNEKVKDIYFVEKKLTEDIVKDMSLETVSEDKEEEKTNETSSKTNEEITNDNKIIEETPKLNLKNEVINIVFGSSLVIANIAKELLDTKIIEDIKEEQELIDIINKIESDELTIEDISLNEEIPSTEEIQTIEETPILPDEETQEETYELEEQEQELNVEKQKRKKEKEELEKKKEEIKKLKEEIKTYEKEQKEIKNIEVNNINIEQESITEINKEDYEDKDYDYLQNEINKSLYEIEMFFIKYDGKITPEQKFKLEQERQKLYKLKDKLKMQKSKDLRAEEISLNQEITAKEIDGLKESLKDIQIENQFDLSTHLINNIEDLNYIESSKAKKIEKLLLKRKLRRTSKIATLTSIAALPFVRNKFFFYLTTGLLINHNLKFIDGILNRKTVNLEEPDLDSITQGQDALNGAIDKNTENLMYIEHIREQAIKRHPELEYDPEYNNYVNKISNRLVKNQEKYYKKQKTMDKLLGRSKKQQKRLILEKQKMINNN